jgi:hypothetical protein
VRSAMETVFARVSVIEDAVAGGKPAIQGSAG